MQQDEDQDKGFVLAPYGELRIFANASGGVTMLQDDPSDGEQVVSFPVELARKVAREILKVADIKGENS